jgi:hypothetical protein
MMPDTVVSMFNFALGIEDGDKWLDGMLNMLSRLCEGLNWKASERRLVRLIEQMEESKAEKERDLAADKTIAEEGSCRGRGGGKNGGAGANGGISLVSATRASDHVGTQDDSLELLR